jgi:hypothetical protein
MRLRILELDILVSAAGIGPRARRGQARGSQEEGVTAGSAVGLPEGFVGFEGSQPHQALLRTKRERAERADGHRPHQAECGLH